MPLRSLGSSTVPQRSLLPYIVLGVIALAIVWGLVATGVWNDILKYRKDIVYLLKQHLVLVAVSGSAAIVTGVLMGVWLSRPWMARHAEATIQVVTHGGTMTRPSAAIARPDMIDAEMTCPPGSIDGKR